MMNKIIMIALSISLGGCCEYACDYGKSEIILIRRGQMQTSPVNKFGNYCYVAWYKGIDHVILLKNGTASDPPFEYKWEPLKLSERGDIEGFYKRNGCEEPK